MVPRYYSGVPLRRTTISCVATRIFGRVISWDARARLASRFRSKSNGAQRCLLRRPSRPAFDSDHAYIALRTNQLVALQLTDGKVLWSVECPMIAPPAAGDGLVFAGSDGLIEARASGGRSAAVAPTDHGASPVTPLGQRDGFSRRSRQDRCSRSARSDGEILWQRDLGSPLAGATCTGRRSRLRPTEGRTDSRTLAQDRRRRLDAETE